MPVSTTPHVTTFDKRRSTVTTQNAAMGSPAESQLKTHLKTEGSEHTLSQQQQRSPSVLLLNDALNKELKELQKQKKLAEFANEDDDMGENEEDLVFQNQKDFQRVDTEGHEDDDDDDDDDNDDLLDGLADEPIDESQLQNGNSPHKT